MSRDHEGIIVADAVFADAFDGVEADFFVGGKATDDVDHPLIDDDRSNGRGAVESSK
jgi:hypothetical protein